MRGSTEEKIGTTEYKNSGFFHAGIRWLAPPANFTHPDRGENISNESLKVMG
jgi:hypothetical protein